MLLVAVLALLTLVPFSSAKGPVPYSPIWLVTQGGAHSDVGWGVTIDDAGMVYFVGATTVPGPLADIFLTKVDPNDGATIWNVTFDGGGDDAAYQVLWAGDTLYVGGRSFNMTDHTLNMLVQAYSPSNGSLIWSTTWESAPGAGYHETDGIVLDGGYLYATGWAAVPGRSEDIGLLKINATTGQLVWAETWGTTGWDEANGDIVVDSDNIYVAGRYNSQSVLYGGKALIVSFQKSDGSYVKNVTWWEGSGEADFLGMTGDSDYLYPVGISATTGDRLVLQKYFHNLSMVWSATWEGDKSESSRMVRISADGMGVYVAGQTASYGNGGADALLLEFDLDGNLLWSAIWGASLSDQPQGLALRGSFAYVSGQTTSFGAGSQDAFLGKFALPSLTATQSSSMSTTTVVSRSSTSFTSSTSATTSSESTKPGGGIPEFPVQNVITLAFTAAVLGAYLLARRGSPAHAGSRGQR